MCKFTGKSNFSHVAASAQKRLDGAQMHPGRRVDSFGGKFSVMQLGKLKSSFGFYDIWPSEYVWLPYFLSSWGRGLGVFV